MCGKVDDGVLCGKVRSFVRLALLSVVTEPETVSCASLPHPLVFELWGRGCEENLVSGCGFIRHHVFIIYF